MKLLDLVTGARLPLVRADLLGDAWEGAFTTPMVEARAAEIARIDALPPAPVKAYPFDAEARKPMREGAYVSCWRMSPTEDAAMWQVYGNRGLAVRSTVADLLRSVTSEQSLMAGVVRYVDFARESFADSGDIFTPLMHKRKEFEYEQELRLVMGTDFSTAEKRTWLWDRDGTVMESWRLVGQPIQYVNFDLTTALKEVRLSPGMPGWCQESLQKIFALHGCASIPVVSSELGGEPSF